MSSYIKSLENAFLAHFSRRLSDLIIEQCSNHLKNLGITTPATAVSSIYFLADNDNVTVADLAEALDVTHQMATQRSNQLEKMGLIYRKPKPGDMRAKTIHLSESGIEESRKLRPFTKSLSAVFDEINEQIECELMVKIRQAELALIEKPLFQRIEKIEASR